MKASKFSLSAAGAHWAKTAQAISPGHRHTERKGFLGARSMKMPMRLVLFHLVVACVAVAGSIAASFPARASTTSYTFAGAITYLDFVTPSVSLGDTISMTFIVDSQPTAGPGGNYFDLVSSSAAVNGITFVGDVGIGSFILKPDQISPNTSSSSGPVFDGVFAPNYFAAMLGGSLIVDISVLPLVINPELFAYSRLEVGFRSGRQRNNLLASIDSVTVSPVPLPAALPLLGASLGALGFVGWRRRRVAWWHLPVGMAEKAALAGGQKPDTVHLPWSPLRLPRG